MKLKNFEIAEEYLCAVTVTTEHDYIKDRDNATGEELIKILKGWNKSVMIVNKDHDEFTRLRNHLEDLGYIEIERRWWNGDRVIKSFKLNGWTFRKNDQFPCAVALSVRIKDE